MELDLTTPHAPVPTLLADAEADADVEFEVAVGEFAPGTKLNRTYEVVREIREGGMAMIYEVEHVRLGRRFAAKVLKAELNDEKHISRMEREARVATSIHHRNVLRVLNLEETDDGRPFLISDLLQGEDLRDRLDRGPMSIDEALEYTAQAASALALVHRAGVVHRDLKPENIYLARQEDGTSQVRLLDFGIARVDDGVRLTTAGAVMGSPKYMAPEQALARDQLDGRADVYTLGLMLYEMLVGTPPFEADKPLDLMLMQIEAPAIRPSLRRPEVDKNVERVVLRALRKDPAKRYADMPRFLAALQQCRRQLGLPPAAVPRVRALSPPHWLRRLFA